MKKLSYFLGLVAMTVMMTMTSCSKDSKGSSADISEDVEEYCDMLDECTDMVNGADSEQSLQNAFFENQSREQRLLSKIDLATELTEDDKEALLESYINYTAAFAYRVIDLGIGANTRSGAESELNEYENRLSDMLEDCETLNDFLNGLTNL